MFSAVGLVITKHPRDQLIDISDAVNFTCEASGSSPITFQWLYNGIELLDEPQYVSGSNTSTIMISNVNFTQWGRYSCVASNIVNNATSDEATLYSKLLVMYAMVRCTKGLYNLNIIHWQAYVFVLHSMQAVYPIYIV